MSNLLFIVALFLWPQGDFTHFNYCVENSRGPWELQCFKLNPEGNGRFEFVQRGADLVTVKVRLSAEVADEFLKLLAGTRYLAEGADYESNRTVANLGTKKLKLEGPGGSREAEFNFSSRQEVRRLVVFFDRLIAQELLMSDIDVALQFDRLAIPKKLEQIEKDLRRRRIVDPKRLVPILNRISDDDRLLNFARETAVRLKKEIEKRN